jgi:hypothetical protein
MRLVGIANMTLEDFMKLLGLISCGNKKSDKPI